ncbi:MAG TPA: DUF1015 domain-containing protein [Solirubrobacteraceae bacterium]|nr:DUF1015 domain-containing protein [Solirubrobacteraceae bacterium]
MAEIKPLQALRYNPAAVGPLDRVLAPPYDVIDEPQRQALLERSPYNVVAIDLPRAAPDPYAAAAELFARWQREGVIVRESEPALYAHEQHYTGPDGRPRTRRGFFCAVRLADYGPGSIRPHERTHPGPREDRLRLMRATRANLSPIFSLYSDPQRLAWSALAPATSTQPLTEVRDEEGTDHRLWRISDADAIAAVRAALADRELLIADGHHRYETALAYAREIDRAGGSGDAHHHVLMCLVALEDPGLTVFPTHRLVARPDEHSSARLQALLAESFESEEITEAELAARIASAQEGGSWSGGERFSCGLLTADPSPPRWITLRDEALLETALPARSDAYRHLDTGVLEALILREALGIGEGAISHLEGFGYARTIAEARQALSEGRFALAFIMRPTPVRQIQAIAAAGEHMPPKSTFFFPKLLTGLLFNPLF